MNPNLLKLIDLLKEKKIKIGFAESCTGGLLSSMFAAVPGVSEVFMGAVVSYSNDIKMEILGVSAETLKRFGAVSLETAKEMSSGALLKLKVDCAVAITGIAGPSGGSASKPVGTVCFSFVGPGIEILDQKLFAGSRSEIQKHSAEHVINSLLNALN